MQIITELPRALNGQVQDALIREIRTGFQLAKAQEDAEEIVAAQEAQTMRDAKAVKGLGLHVWEMPQDGYFRLLKKYGHDELHSKEFARYLRKNMKHLTSHSV